MTAGRYGKWSEGWRPKSEVWKVRDRRSEDGGQRVELENQRMEAIRSNRKEARQLNHKVAGQLNQRKGGWTVW
jgi:hypothetical protein